MLLVVVVVLLVLLVLLALLVLLVVVLLLVLLLLCSQRSAGAPLSQLPSSATMAHFSCSLWLSSTRCCIPGHGVAIEPRYFSEAFHSTLFHHLSQPLPP